MSAASTSRSRAAWRDVSMLQTAHGPVETAQAGAGPAVLVIHGLPGSWRQCFSLAEDLADAFHVIAPSRPGYGTTPLASGRSFADQADLYAAMLDALGIERATIVGASGGGPSAVAFAQRHPDRCSALVLVCALHPEIMPVPTGLKILVPWGLGEALTGLSRAVNRRRIENPKAVARWMQKALTPEEAVWAQQDERMPGDLVAFARTHLEAPPGLAGVRNDLAQLRAVKAAPRPWIAVNAPTLVMHGDKDEVVGLAHPQHHVDAIDGAQLQIYEGAAHAFFFTRRREVAQHIRSFLESTVSP
jgi:pimeloyl-ACP methyl ester carboxylesterase